MTAAKRVTDDEPGDVEALLPWHAAGTLSARDIRRVEEALARHPDLAKQYAVIRDEYVETISLNESLGAPSVGALQKLFAAIDAEPALSVPIARLGLWARISQFFSDLSPRTLAAVGAVGALVVLLQAGVIAAILAKDDGGQSFRTASHSAPDAPLTRRLAVESGPQALVRFAPEARMSDISAFLDTYQATIVSVSRNGLFRVRFDQHKDFPGLLGKLQSEAIVNLAVPAE